MRKAIGYAQQIARGMAAAHRRGIAHRDLKPENLFITRDGLVKLLDFGLAKLAREAFDTTILAEATTPGIVMGTIGYMSPEQARGETSDSRADIFSFGAILYEMLSGRRAFQRASAELREIGRMLFQNRRERFGRRCDERAARGRDARLEILRLHLRPRTVLSVHRGRAPSADDRRPDQALTGPSTARPSCR